jgi:hypothetical protein
MRALFLCICITSACSPTAADIQPLVSGLAAAVLLGQTSSLAMEAMASKSTCASVKTACPTFPCQGAVTVTYGSDCPVPLGGDVGGTVEVSGTWQSVDQATLSASFVQVSAGTRTAVVVNASNLSVTRSPNQVAVEYTWQNVNVQAGVRTLSAQSSWHVEAGFNNTPDVPADDDYFIRGTDQSVSSQVLQVSTSDIPVLASCRRNPTGGTATLQKVSATSIVQTQVRFHQECDGKADADGQSIALDFLH